MDLHERCIQAVKASSAKDLTDVHYALYTMNSPTPSNIIPTVDSILRSKNEETTSAGTITVNLVLQFIRECAEKCVDLITPLDNDIGVLEKYCDHIGPENDSLDKVCVFPAVKRDGQIVKGLYACVVRHADCGSYLNINMNPNLRNTMLEFDISAYMGLWYEIAYVQSWFEFMPQGQVTALYKLLNTNGSGLISVRNAVKLADGLPSYVNEGEATMNPDRVGVLNVSISPIPIPEPLRQIGRELSTFNPSKENYWIIRLGAKQNDLYSYSVVYSKSSGLIWILSRTPCMSHMLYNELIAFIRSRGIDLKIIERTNAVYYNSTNN